MSTAVIITGKARQRHYMCAVIKYLFAITARVIRTFKSVGQRLTLVQLKYKDISGTRETRRLALRPRLFTCYVHETQLYIAER